MTIENIIDSNKPISPTDRWPCGAFQPDAENYVTEVCCRRRERLGQIQYLLFAYREVPQATTGFSPFELLYGRDIRGPLDVLRESLESHQRSSDSIMSYVLTM